MTGPHPIVGIGSKFSNRFGRGTYQSYIVIYFIYKQIIFISTVERFHNSPELGVFGGLFYNNLVVCIDNAVALGFAQVIGKSFQAFGSYFFHVLKKLYFKSFNRDFFVFVHGPETIVQIIVFGCAYLLNGTVSTVVVGQDQTLGRNNFSGTSTTKNDDCIFQTGMVNAVNVISREF